MWSPCDLKGEHLLDSALLPNRWGGAGPLSNVTCRCVDLGAGLGRVGLHLSTEAAETAGRPFREGPWARALGCPEPPLQMLLPYKPEGLTDWG